MANHKSALKRAHQNEIRRMRNRTVRTRVKNVTKEVRQAVKENDPAMLRKKIDAAQSAIDKAAKKGVLHPRTAARKISRLTKAVDAQANPS